MLCVVIKGPSYEEAHCQIAKALDFADSVELRLDCFSELDSLALNKLRSHFSIPMIFTLRSSIQGGVYAKSEECRLSDIERLAAIKPDYFDLENHIPAPFIEGFASKYPAVKIILSTHHFSETPNNLEELYRELRKIPAFLYKIAVMANSSLDAIRFLCWAKQANGKLIAVSMGPFGQISRILAPVIGSPLTYASLDDDLQTAPGQLTAEILLHRYRHRSLSSQTAIYGLIGDPVDMSISDETHNHLISRCKLDAVYIKIHVKASELGEFLHLARQLPIQGLSVTMPLKEGILSHLDLIEHEAYSVGAVNTLLFQGEKIIGYNTDSKGALNAIEQVVKVKERRIVMIGAGGAAKAIAFEAQARGALVTIINRDEERAHQVAARFNCSAKGLGQMEACFKEGYDILINCTPLPMPISSDLISSKAMVMDIRTKPRITPFIESALEKGCPVVFGYRMFVEQALGQFQIWFKERIDIEACRPILEAAANEALAHEKN